MSEPQKRAAAAVRSLKDLRALAKSTGYPPSGDAELGRLVREVETISEAVRAHAVETIAAERDRNQPGLFGSGAE